MLNLKLWAFNLTFEAQVFKDDGFRTYSAVCSQCHLGMNYQNDSDSRVEKKVKLSWAFDFAAVDRIFFRIYLILSFIFPKNKYYEEKMDDDLPTDFQVIVVGTGMI